MAEPFGLWEGWSGNGGLAKEQQAWQYSCNVGVEGGL